MTGANYSSFGCSSSRRKSGVVIFKVPQEDDEKSSNWRKSIIRVATKDRVVDKALRQRIIKKIFSFVKNIILKINLKDVCTKLSVL